MSARPTLAVRIAGLADAWCAGTRRRALEAAAAAWELLGGGQARNLLLAVLAVLGMHVARQVERGEAEMTRVAEAQGVMGYATMRQLEAVGLGPNRASSVAERRVGDASGGHGGDAPNARGGVGPSDGTPTDRAAADASRGAAKDARRANDVAGGEPRAIDPAALQQPAAAPPEPAMTGAVPPPLAAPRSGVAPSTSGDASDAWPRAEAGVSTRPSAIGASTSAAVGAGPGDGAR